MMNYYNDNETLDLMNLFIDGEIDEPQQRVLFQKLHENPDLQNMFRQTININKSIEFDKDFTNAPAEVTSSLFLKAGFSDPFHVPQNVSQPKSFVRHFSFNNIFTNLAIPGIVAVASSLITAIVLYFGVFNHQNSNVNTVNNSSLKGNQNIANNMQIPMVSSYDNSLNSSSDNSNKSNSASDNFNSSKNSVNLVKHINNNYNASNNKNIKADNSNNKEIIANDDNSKQTNELATIQDNSKQEKEQNIIQFPNIIYISEPANNINKYMQGHDNNILVKMPYMLSFDNDKKMNMVIEIRQLNGIKYFPDRVEHLTNTADINNLAIVAFYKFNDNNWLGVQGGKESFQLYKITSMTNSSFERISNLAWFGISYRYNTDKLDWLFSTNIFTEITLGGSIYGGIVKPIVGLNYYANENLSLGIGVEGTALIYQFQQHTNWTQKLGLTYRIGYNF